LAYHLPTLQTQLTFTPSPIPYVGLSTPTCLRCTSRPTARFPSPCPTSPSNGYSPNFIGPLPPPYFPPHLDVWPAALHFSCLHVFLPAQPSVHSAALPSFLPKERPVRLPFHWKGREGGGGVLLQQAPYHAAGRGLDSRKASEAAATAITRMAICEPPGG